jgi:ribosomal protein S18 acetylase RimI-like enzyme
MVKSIAFITDVALRRMEGATATERDGYLVIRTPDNPGFWWGNFLLLDAAPEPGTAGRWLDRFAAEFPGAKHVALGIDTTDAGTVIPADFTAAGLEPERSITLTATDVTAPAHVNNEAEIRALAADDDWQQTVDLCLRLYAGEGLSDIDYYRGRMEARRRIAEQGRGVWLGAFDDGRLVAQLGLFLTGDGFARYQDVETDPAVRRRGLAGTLVWQAGRHGLDELGARTLVIVADREGDAIRLYRSLGFSDFEGQLGLCRPPAGDE